MEAKTYDEEINAYQDVANGRLFGVNWIIRSRSITRPPNPNSAIQRTSFGQIVYGIAIKKGNTELQQEINKPSRR